MKSIIWTQDYKVNSLLVNTQRKLGIFALMNLFQDAAWNHADDQGHGYEASLAQKAFWVLTRQKLFMERWPKWGETLQIKTWVRPPIGAHAIRDFEVWVAGKKCGECSSTWLRINSETHRPLKHGADEVLEVSNPIGHLDIECTKIELHTDVSKLETVAEFQVRNSDLDMNLHVNNTRYTQWVLDSIPLSRHTEVDLKKYEINFLAETKIGDVLEIQRIEIEKTESFTWLQYQGMKQADKKYAFVARLRVEEKIK